MSESTTGVVRGILHNDSAAIAFKKAVSTRGKGVKTDLRVKRVELVVRCQELSRFLRGFNELTWASWIDEAVVEIRQNSREGIRALLDGYNGIGSISDVYLCPEAGHRVNARDEAAINEQYLLMLGKVNNLALEISEQETPPI